MDLSLNQTLSPQIRQTLELTLTPKMLTMLKLLNLPYQELLAEIQKESEENVMLEVEHQDDFLEMVQYLNSNKKIKKEVDFKALPGLENVGNAQQTLPQYLLNQLTLEKLPPLQCQIAEKLIGALNNDGYLQDYPAVREQIEKELQVSRPTVDKVLKIIQAFEPDGVGARNLKECLQIQLAEHNFENAALQEIIETIIEKYLEDLAAANFSKIAAALNIREEGVKQVAAFIKGNLNPRPGSAFGGEERHLVPSFALLQSGNTIKVINLEEKYGPKLTLSREYEKMLSHPPDEKTRAYLKEKLEKARALIDGVKKRQETQNKIAAKLVDEQLLFFQKGGNWVKPLLQKSIAEELGIHPSTVSRALSEKYIQTPKGIFHLKFLCQRSWLGVPKTRLKELIEEIIQNAAQAENVSDEKIRQKLAEHKIVASRRTIAEYRRQLEIPSSKERGKGINKIPNPNDKSNQ